MKENEISAEDLSSTALKIYLYLLERTAGPREIARALNLNPSLVYYHLKRLEELGLVERCSEGYRVRRTIKISGYIVLGRKLIPRLTMYAAAIYGIVMAFLVSTLAGFVELDAPSIILLIVLAITGLLMAIEGLVLDKKLRG